MAKKITDEEFKEYYESNPELTQDCLAEHFGVKQSTISKKINKIYGDKEKRIEGKSLNTIYSLPELIKRSEIYTQTHTIYIKTGIALAEQLRKKLLNEYNSKNTYHIIDIIKCNNGLLIITNDLLLGEKLKSLTQNQ